MLVAFIYYLLSGLFLRLYTGFCSVQIQCEVNTADTAALFIAKISSSETVVKGGGVIWSPVLKHWLAKDIPSYGGQSKREKCYPLIWKVLNDDLTFFVDVQFFVDPIPNEDWS